MNYYISGKIGQGTEAERQANKKLLIQWTNYYRFLGYNIISPLELDHTNDVTWLDHMRTDIRALLECDGIIMTPNWVTSKGAGVERNIAKALGYKIIYPIGYSAPQ